MTSSHRAKIELNELKKKFCKLFHKIRKHQPLHVIPVHRNRLLCDYLNSLISKGVIQELRRLYDEIIKREPEWEEHWCLAK